jgi:hypothetical protein
VSGAVLVLTAVVTFIAFIWGSVGPYGQAGILLLIAVAFGIAARTVRLAATRETFACISWGIIFAEVAAAPGLQLVPADLYRFGGLGLPIAVTTVGALTAVAARLGSFASLRALAWALYPAAIWTWTLTAYEGMGLLPEHLGGSLFLCSMISAFAFLVTGRTPREWSARVVVAAMFVVLASWILVAYLVAPGILPRMPGELLLGAALAGFAGILVTTRPAKDGSLVVAGSLVAIALAELVVDVLGSIGGAGVIALIGAATLAVGHRRRHPIAGVILSSALWITWLASLPVQEGDRRWSAMVFLAILALSSLGYALAGRLPLLALAFAACSGLSWLLLVDLLWHGGLPAMAIGSWPPPIEIYTLAGLVISLITIGVLRWGGRIDTRRAAIISLALTLAVASASTMALWWWIAEPSAPVSVPLSAAIAAAGVLIWLGAGVAGDTAGYWIGSVAVATTWCAWMASRIDDAQVVWFSATVGVAYLVAGFLTWLRYRDLPSMAWLAPGVALTLDAYVLVEGSNPRETPAGFIIVLSGCVLATAIGAVRGLAGALIPGVVGIAFIVVVQIVAVVGVIPVWASLAVGGAVLLALGVRMEATRSAIRSGATWVAGLH